MTDPDFNADDLINAVLGQDHTQELPSSTAPADPASGAKNPTAAPAAATGARLGWILVLALFVAASVAISLAVQTNSDASTRQPPRCGGLYSNCCDDWDDNWGECPDLPITGDRYPHKCVGLFPTTDGPNQDGLFDSERVFADC